MEKGKIVGEHFPEDEDLVSLRNYGSLNDIMQEEKPKLYLCSVLFGAGRCSLLLES